MLRASELESRQSDHSRGRACAPDAPRLGIGIKAKLNEQRGAKLKGCSAPRNWNQGKAERGNGGDGGVMLRASELESRQSNAVMDILGAKDAPRLGIGIKAKPRSQTTPAGS